MVKEKELIHLHLLTSAEYKSEVAERFGFKY